MEQIARHMAEVVQTLECEAEQRKREGHWLESRMIHNVAAYFMRWEFEKANELLVRIGPDQATQKWISSLLDEERDALVHSLLIDLAKQGVKKSTRRLILGKYQTLRSHRPASSRQWAAQAIERRERGEKWTEIEKALLPPRKDEPPDGERIRRSAQHLMQVLAKHGISSKPE